MFNVPRLIQICNDYAPGLSLGMDKSVVADIEPHMVRRYAVG
jgi:hypothetical protein